MKLFSTRSVKGIPKDDHWIPLSDLMSGLMMMFLLIAVIFMVKVEAQQKQTEALRERAEILRQRAEEQSARMKDVAVLYDQMREQLYRDLEFEFRNDLRKWKATLDRDLTVRFEEPEVLFATGRSDLRMPFVTILNEFFPRYVRIISSERYKDSIEEIRIEGHTSSFWSGAGVNDAYFLNMELSQSRTRSTLQHLLSMPTVSQQREWLKGRLTANGLSSSRLRVHPDGTENREASQRVEFRVRTNAEARIGEILQTAAK